MAIQPVDMNPNRPRHEAGTGADGPHTRRTDRARASASGNAGAAGALAAGPGFAVAVLVEAGLTGADPWLAGRRLRAYGGGAAPGGAGTGRPGAVRFVA